jgi:uncharacterized sporulation protein YeaH/YhbH (DUF444 family)
MTKRIGEDHRRFRDVISGRTRKQLKRLIKSGSIVRQRGKNGRVVVSIPSIDMPHIAFGDNGEGVGRGPGKEGDVIGRDPQQGQGGQAGEEHQDGFLVSVDMEDVLKIMKEDLELPDMVPKSNQTFDEVKIKYNDISKTGPESLRHTRRTMQEAIKRLAMIGDLDKKVTVPYSAVPMKVITPINSDRRYRQYKEIKIPSTNAAIFFARDCSGSMDLQRCEIASDMCWWIDTWLRQYYQKVERCYFIHDTLAEEVSEQKFYNYREGGGTLCSSVFELMAKQLENRFPPDAYNVYIFYFTDGDNRDEKDNYKILELLKNNLSADFVNLVGITQICTWGGADSVKDFIDMRLSQGDKLKNVVTAEIGKHISGKMDEDLRNAEIIDGIKKLLGKQVV